MVAMQRMIRVVFHDQTDKRVVINVNDYRQQREAKIVDRATEIAYRVLESGRPYRFGPMPANERFVIHTTISENPEFVDLVSYSEGEGAARQLIIAPKEAIAVD
jgi:spoIIIJ-associated protein